MEKQGEVEGSRKKTEMPILFFFLLCADFRGNDEKKKTDGRVKCLAEHQNSSLHLQGIVNTLIFLCFAKDTWEPFPLVNETIKINELIW